MRSTAYLGRITATAAMLWLASAQAVEGLALDGEAIFKSRCAVCHGIRADGRSDLARIMRPPPANLRRSVLSDKAQSDIVRRGGAALGRSPSMPEWGVELTEEELRAVLAYIKTVKEPAP